MSAVYTRDSRYRQVDEVARVDAAGRELVVTDLRRRPQRAGTFQHTVEDGDRLDHLGHRYYRRSRLWWRIGDANPELLSPLRLLGHDPLRRLRFVVQGDPAPAQPWSAALRVLARHAGVERVTFAVEERPQRPIPLVVGVLTVELNALTTSEDELAALLADEGFEAGPAEQVGRVGKPIVVPPQGATSQGAASRGAAPRRAK